MGLPRHLPPESSGSGHGPFGEKAFKAALIACLVLLVVGTLLVVLAGGAGRSVGVCFLVLGALGLSTAGAGLLAERLLQRRPPPPSERHQGNGQRPYRPGPARAGRFGRRP